MTFLCLKNVGTDRYSVLIEVALEIKSQKWQLMFLAMDNKFKENREEVLKNNGSFPDHGQAH